MVSHIGVSETILKENIYIGLDNSSFLINLGVLIYWEYALTHFKPFDFKTTVFTSFLSCFTIFRSI